jgi:transposase
LAVKVAGRHGVSRTATALKLDYYALKDRLLAQPVRAWRAAESTSPGSPEAGVGGCLGRHEDTRQAEGARAAQRRHDGQDPGVDGRAGESSLAREQQMTAEERLQFHQQASGPTMARLREWLKRQSEQKLVEPNSGLGTAINYVRKHWEKLTLFLRVAGAPLDNNICERALKKAILHRKNALFFKTKHGAAVGDLYLSLIHTCELNGGNPFEYLTALQRHAAAVAAAPGEWMPWNYGDRLECLAAG